MASSAEPAPSGVETTLSAFLLAQIAEDEARARAYLPIAHLLSTLAWAAYHSPARVLAECAAKRRIVEAHPLSPYYGLDRYGRWLPHEGEPKFYYCDCESSDGMIGRGGPCETLRALASVYADRPGYRDEWRLDVG